MTAIGSLNGVFGTSAATALPSDARQAALGAMEQIGGRVLAWVGAVSGAAPGPSGEFQPDTTELARGGDVYGLGGLGRDLTVQFGGTPKQEGDLHRSLENFTREAVIQIAGLSGGDATRQTAGVREALAAADASPAEPGMEGIATRIDAGTAVLARQNGTA